MEIYPIKFKPILKNKIWGGNKLKKSLNKNSKDSQVGESWELSSVKNDESIIVNGVYEDKNITELITEFSSELLGNYICKVFGYAFPLLFKFIDANSNLSMQLHPNNQLANKRHACNGKTEMWFVIESEANSQIYSGLKSNVTNNDYIIALENKSIVDIVRREKVRSGDAFFIDAGTIHAIGEGVLLAEIQQTSDITYRLYDWNRVYSDGMGRELHLDLANDAIDFKKNNSTRLNYSKTKNHRNLVKKCNYFSTNYIEVDIDLSLSLKEIDSFIVYMCIAGNGTIEVEGNSELIQKGDTVLIPSIATNVYLIGDDLKLLETYIEYER